MGRKNFRIDIITIANLLAIGLFGIFVLLSINRGFAIEQTISLIVGLVVLLIVSRIDGSIFYYTSPFLYVLIVFLLIITYFFPAIRGARRWIEVPGFQIQTSEAIKPLFLLSIAWFLSKFPPKKIHFIILHAVLFLIPTILIFKEPDLGTAIVFLSSWLGMMIAAGLPLPVLIVSILTCFVGMPFAWTHLAQYQQDRIITFLNPGIDPQGAGYNALQAMIAVGSGRVFGRGFGRGTQSQLQFLPERHTDFIFASLVEEFGLLGGAFLLFLYGLLLFRMLSPLLRGAIKNSWTHLFTIGFFMMIVTQVVINTGMNMGVVPVTGITLPLVSYGGSSIFSIGLSFGVFFSVLRSDIGNPHVAI
jgi:rod shape determining protein RodA